MLLAHKQLNPLQRRSGLMFGSFLILTMFAFIAAHLADEHGQLAKPLLRLIELLPVLPIAVMIATVGRYLARETDEFIRMTVTQSLLWGMGVTMIGDICFGVLFEGSSTYGLTQIYNIDAFCITAMLALFIQLRTAQ